MDNFLGEIRMFAGNFAPQGWNFCDGTLLSISNYDSLFVLIGTTYGGDGQTTFQLPDLRGRLPIGQGNGSGLSPRTLGQSLGEEGHVLTATEMAAHAHPAVVSTAAATTVTAGPSVTYGAAQGNQTAGVYGLYTTAQPPDAPAVQWSGATVGNMGGSQPHDNTMNTLTVNFIIALEGIFPSQN